MEIKQRYPHMSVLIITAYKEIPKAFQLIQHGAIDYLNKPFKSMELFKALGITWLSKQWPQIKDRISLVFSKLLGTTAFSQSTDQR